MIALFIILAAIANAAMDKINFHFKKSIFPDTNWVNPEKSWVNKYKYKHPVFRFLFSTVLVFTTDFWHMCKFIWLKLILFAILFAAVLVIHYSIIELVIMFILLWALYSFIFEVFFAIIFDKKTTIVGYIKNIFNYK